MGTSVSPCREVTLLDGKQRDGVHQVAQRNAGLQGLTLVHFLAQRKHFLWDR